MKRNPIVFLVLTLGILFASCNNGGEETPESIAKQWCDLNGKVARATTPEEKEKAEKNRKEYEEKIDKKYKDNEEMRKKVEVEVEKCEDASEGR
jgi:hypothetical protein